MYLRTTDGDSLLLSVQEPEQLLAELRERAPRPWSAREPAGMADTGIWGMLAGASTQTPACA